MIDYKSAYTDLDAWIRSMEAGENTPEQVIAAAQRHRNDKGPQPNGGGGSR